MAHIDRYIEVLASQADGILSFVTGEKVSLTMGGASHPLSPTEASAGQLAALFKPIVPPEMAADFDAGKPVDFQYTAPAGPVQVSVRRLPSGMGAVITPLARTPSAAAARPVQAEIPLRATMAEMPAVRVGATSAAMPAVRPPPPPPPRVATSPAPPPLPAGAVAAAAAMTGSPAGGGILQGLFAGVLEAGGSDLHLCSGTVPVMRKDGDIMPLGPQWGVLAPDLLEQGLREILPPQNRSQFDTDHDTDFAYELPGRGRFRVNVYRDRNGVAAACRHIPSQIRSVEELRLPKPVVDLCSLRKGLVVVTGPSGTGKTTTLASMLDYVNRTRADHIITMEDPIEFVHINKRCLINQRELFAHTRSFKAALRAALREDPNTVLIGELRDRETMEMALETAETGHLVFATLHTVTAPGAVDRIIDIFPTDQRGAIQTLLADTLKGVVAQTLCKKIGGGRVAALEVLIVTPSTANIIREGKTFQIPSAMQTSRNVGCVQLNDSLLDLVRSRQVTPEEALDKSPARKDLAQLLSRAGINGPWSAEA